MIGTPRARRSLLEPVVVLAALLGVTCVMTWPVVTDLGGLGRLRLNDGRWSIWVVSWVAHALTTSPWQVYDANIFYPHTRTLLMSEPNLVAGLIAAPAWVLTRNPLLAHNVAFLASFVLSGAATYALAKHLVRSRFAAAVAAMMFAFSPYAFAHTAHIQLEMTAGLPLVLLAIHRHVDEPSLRRGALIGLAVAFQALACGYYGVLSAMTAPAAIMFFAVSRGLWRNRAYWIGAVSGAAVSALIVIPVFLPYLEIQQATGFTRGLAGSQMYSAVWQSYVASAAWAHRWWLGRLGDFKDALFPGFCAVVLAPVGAWMGTRYRGRRELVIFYAGLIVLAFWLSLGPAGGLYTALYNTVVVFSFLRAPSRLGVAVILGFAILSAFGVEALRARLRGKMRTFTVLVPLLVMADLVMVPVPFDPMPPVSNSYRMLASLPRGPVAEFPFYWRTRDLQHHALYMLFSTYHWQPLINGYSDIFPQDFGPLSHALAGFPSDEAMKALRQRGARYLVVNYPRYRSDLQKVIEDTMAANREHFRELQRDNGVVVYEVVSW